MDHQNNSCRTFRAVYYNSVENSGTQNNQAYMTANLELLTLDFALFDMLPVPLCHDTMVADSSNENECPGTGSYDFSVNYTLPGAGSEKTSWLASGWGGKGLIQMFAEVDDTMKIGECGLDLLTYVTRQESNASMVNFFGLFYLVDQWIKKMILT
jgi:hypothetical protein